ncbi:MAG TPA: hypothetical protein VIX81_05275 [Gammaproteobacteria bacterium]
MVDEEAFRSAWSEIDALHCPFAKALLGGFADCRYAQRIHLAERVGIGCREAAVQATCVALLERLRADARFALHTTHASGALPHALAMRLQVGGVNGLRNLLDPAAGDRPVGDIAGLLGVALARYGGVDAIPCASLVQAVAHFAPRRPRGSK